jgi:hypothetical protein
MSDPTLVAELISNSIQLTARLVRSKHAARSKVNLTVGTLA